jgi:hypothetical protein
MKTRATLVQPLIRFAALVLLAFASWVSPASAADPSRWLETRWPFLIDQWGLGSAYFCGSADCGADVMLFLRAKVGFCNCTTGIVEDEEIDRVGDLNLVGWQSRARALGEPVTVGWMKGRSRAFVVEGRDRRERHALTVALSNKCDAVVATVVADQPISSDIERAARDFLSSTPILTWAAANTGL